MYRLRLIFLGTIYFCNVMHGMGAPTIKWGLAARQGDRPAMEDAHVHILNFDSKPTQAFFAIYDGHGRDIENKSIGKEASLYAEEHLHTYFLRNKRAGKSIEQSFTQAFHQTDQEIMKLTDAGSAAVAISVDGDQAYIAWVGDSRAIIIRNGKVIFETEDHKPLAPREKERLVQSGVDEKKLGGNRIIGLAMSRSLGDRAHKEAVPGGVISTPEIKKLKLEAGDEIILACDGVWDTITTAEAIPLVTDVVAQKQLEEFKKICPAQPRKRNGSMDQVTNMGNDDTTVLAARVLRDAAYNKGSKDNISAMVIVYGKQPRAQELQELEKKYEESLSSQDKKLILDRLNELEQVARESKLKQVATQVQAVFNLLKVQVVTKDILTIAKEMLQEINPNTKIQYFGQPTKISILIDPIVKKINNLQ